MRRGGWARRGLDLPQALAVVSEAVWWVTMVDATVVRYHADAYDRVLAGLDPAGRRAAEETLGGLWFVRNQMGYHADPADFVRPRQAQGGGDLPVAEWAWEPVPAPAAGPAPQARAWERSRYRHYRARLAGQPAGRSGSRPDGRAAGRTVGQPAGRSGSRPDGRGGGRVPVPAPSGRRPRREEPPHRLTCAVTARARTSSGGSRPGGGPRAVAGCLRAPSPAAAGPGRRVSLRLPLVRVWYGLYGLP